MAPARQLRICQANVRSLSASSRLLELEILTANHNIDILCLTETWLSKSKPNNSVILPGFQPPFRRDRPNRPGGGVAIYVRNGLSATHMHLPSTFTSETLCLTVHHSKRKKMIVVVSYRPPGPGADKYCSELDNILDFVRTNSSSPLYLVGDFNAKSSQWLETQQTDGAGQNLHNLSCSHDLTQVISKPTYGLDSSTPSLLDLMFTNKPDLVLSSSVLPPLTDHCPTIMDLKLRGNPLPPPSIFYSWDLNGADFAALRSALSATDWSFIYNERDVDEAVRLWTSAFTDLAEKYVPVKKRCVRSKTKPWYSPYLRKIARFRDRLFRRSRGKALGSPEMVRYRKIRNWYVNELRRAEKDFYQSLSCSLGRSAKSSHNWWSKIKAAANWTVRQQVPPLSVSGMLYVTPQDKANAINAVFSKQCSAPSLTTPVPPPNLAQKRSSFEFDQIAEDSVLKVLRNLNVWKACGLDNIPNRMLKECAEYIYKPLCCIFNQSIRSGVFPQYWKVAKIQPVYKHKGNRSDPVNYRPIALLCSISKVLEQLIHKQLLNFCLRHDLIPDEQFGFLPGRSTTWQLLSLMEEWHEALDAGRTVHALFLDVSKAFDRVDHHLLLEQCRNYGLTSTPLAWFKSYLSGRSIVTCVDQQVSSPLPTTSGVPQGSVLGPLLFLLYFSSLPSAPRSCSTAMFADDSLIYTTHCSLNTKSTVPSACCPLQEDTNHVASWAAKWNTRFNATKSASFVIHRARHSKSSPAARPLSLCGDQVPSSPSVRHLGVILSSTLHWSSHVSHIIQSVAWKVSLLKHLAFACKLPFSTFSLLYKTLLRPCLEYASCVWDNCTTADSLSLERIQLSLARSILSSKLGSHSVSNLSKSKILSILSWPTLSWRRRRQKLFYFWSLKKGLGPPTLSRRLPSSISDRCSYNLRTSHSSQVPLCSSSAHLSSFLASSCILWNSLPASIVSCDKSSLAFKRAVDKFFEHDMFSFGIPQ